MTGLDHEQEEVLSMELEKRVAFVRDGTRPAYAGVT